MKRLFIPRNYPEAERFLWHAMDHLRESEHREGAHSQDVPANTAIYAAIKLLQVATDTGEK